MKPSNFRGSVWPLLFVGLGLASACTKKADVGSRPAPAAAGSVTELPARSRGPVLVVLSSSNRLPLKEGRSYATGYFLNELMVPVRALINAHYEPVFATPSGTSAVMDPHSDGASFFASAAEYQEISELRHRLHDIHETRSLANVLAAGLEPYRALLVPGGHAAMGDLTLSPELGQVLKHFHDRLKPTAVICHGPGALLSTLAPGFVTALVKGDEAGAKAASGGFPYAGYHLTAFSTAEERAVEEGGAGGFLGGKVQFYLDQALALAGARVDVQEPFKSHVVVDRELISAQQPASDGEFTRALMSALEKSEPSGPVTRN